MTVPPPLSPQLVMGGGWNEKYARVLKIEQAGRSAVAIVDGNGDGAYLALEEWQFRRGGWSCLSWMGFGFLDQAGDAAAATERCVYIVGSERPGTRVVFQWRGARHEAVADDNGLWVYVVSDSSASREKLPRVIQRMQPNE